MAEQGNGDVRELVVTKVVTLRDIEQNPSPSPEKWVVKCFKVLDSLQELSPIREWELADTSHVVLHLDVPNQQLYHLPLLIMRIHCVYLVTFDLRNGEKALETIHKTMNHVSAFVSYNAESLLDNCSPSKVLLVGTHQEKLSCEQKRQFAEKLQESLKNRHDDLIVKPDDEEFWTVDGDCIDLQNGPLSKEIILHSCLPKVPTWQCMKYDEELRSMCCQGQKVKTIVKSMVPNISCANTKKFLTFLHDYGFIVYSPYAELQEEDTTVVLEPQYLCQQFSNAQQLSKKKNGKATVADLFSRSPELALSVRKKWFEKFCINMGLVIEQPIRKNEKNLVFVLNRQLQSETVSKASPVCSVDPLLVMVRLQDEDDYYIPPRFFAVFASTFPERLQEKCTETLRVRVNSMSLRKSHIVVEWKAGCSIVVVEQESCIEISFQLLFNSGCTEEDKLKKLQIRCQMVNEAVDESAKCAVEKLMLPSNECVQYGYYHTCDKIGTRITDSHGTIFECCCGNDTPFTPMQKIWFQNVMDCQVHLQRNKDDNILKLVEGTDPLQHTPSPQPTPQQQSTANQAKHILGLFRVRFITEMESKSIVYDLESMGIITNGVLNEVIREADTTLQNKILYASLERTSTKESLMRVCDVIIDVEGNPLMMSFGEDMKRMLEGQSCGASST